MNLLRQFSAFLAGRRWPYPQDSPAPKHAAGIGKAFDSTERERTERKKIMLVRNVQTGQTAHAKNSDEQIHTLVKLGVLEYVNEPPNQVARAVRHEGHVIVGTFRPEGPMKCSGLDVVRYDAESLHREFGSISACWTAPRNCTKHRLGPSSSFSIATAKSSRFRS